MANNSTNINKTKESLNSDGQQFHQYQQNKRKFKTEIVNNSTNINKTKESLNSDGQQFHQYQQNKRKFKQWWTTILPISTKQKKVLTVMVNNSTNINKTKESLKSYGQQFHQYQQNKGKSYQWWSTIPPISRKQKKVLTVMGNNSANINKTKKKVLTGMVNNSTNINKTKKKV